MSDKSSLGERLGLGLILALFIGLICVLTFDLDSKLMAHYMAPPKTDPIAKIEHAHKTLKVKRFGSLVFEELREGEPLYPNDEVFSDADSRGLVSYPSNDKLHIDANSLVEVKSENGHAHVHVKAGRIEAHGKMSISVDGHKIHSDGHTIIHRPKSGSMHVEVVHGHAVLHHESGQKIHLKSGHSIKHENGTLHPIEHK